MSNINVKSLIEYVSKRINSSKKVLLLLDYDGTLVNFTPKPEDAILTHDMKELLVNINQRPGIKVIINTGRGYSDIEYLLNEVSIDVVAEHGTMYRKNGIWKNLAPSQYSWKSKVLPYLRETTLKCEKSFVEEKAHSICWHYRNADLNEAKLHAEDLLQMLDVLSISTKFKVLKGKFVIEITSGLTNKGIATTHLLQNDQYDMVIAIGDDTTDEDMFDALSGEEHHLSVKVGEGSSIAKFRINSVEQTWEFIKSLTL